MNRFKFLQRQSTLSERKTEGNKDELIGRQPFHMRNLFVNISLTLQDVREDKD